MQTHSIEPKRKRSLPSNVLLAVGYSVAFTSVIGYAHQKVPLSCLFEDMQKLSPVFVGEVDNGSSLFFPSPKGPIGREGRKHQSVWEADMGQMLSLVLLSLIVLART